MSARLLEVRNLRLEFPGLVHPAKILRGVDLDIEAGDVLGLVGESGCGKSMTALACLGLVPAPGRIHGSIKLNGREIAAAPAEDMASIRGGNIAMVFQNPSQSLNPFFTVGRQLVEIIRCHRAFSQDEAVAEAVKELTAVQIPDPEIVLSRFPHQLSGGQAQRVMIALALACRPALLIADEPTTALDVTVQAQIMSLLLELSERTGLTILFITHDLGVVSSLCNRVAVMYAGSIVESGSVENVIDHPRHPYTTKLINTVPAIGRSDQKLEFIPGRVPDPRFLPSGCAFHDRCEYATSICTASLPQPERIAAHHIAACHHVARPETSTRGEAR